jgi:hypothetical protein
VRRRREIICKHLRWGESLRQSWSVLCYPRSPNARDLGHPAPAVGAGQRVSRSARVMREIAGTLGHHRFVVSRPFR